jgi:hypothetical protein
MLSRVHPEIGKFAASAIALGYKPLRAIQVKNTDRRLICLPELELGEKPLSIDKTAI